MPDGAAIARQPGFQVEPLKEWLTAQTGANGVHIEPLELLPGGAVQQNWALNPDFEGGRLPGCQKLVLRTNFQTPLPASEPKALEFAVLQAVAAVGVTVPEPLWLCEDPGVIGQPFFVMRRLAGDADARNLVAAAAREGFGIDLAKQLAGELARTHRLMPGDLALDFLGSPSAPSALGQVAKYRRWLAELGADGRLFAELDWLEQNAPPQRRTCLVHRDFRSGNFLVEDGRLTAVLDWEFAGWGDPHEDIGWLCASCWRAGGDQLEAGGLANRGEFYAAYEAAGGLLIDEAAVAYWEVMAHLRWAIIARQQGVRAAQGDVPQHELLEAVARVPGLERDISNMTEAL